MNFRRRRFREWQFVEAYKDSNQIGILFYKSGWSWKPMMDTALNQHELTQILDAVIRLNKGEEL